MWISYAFFGESFLDTPVKHFIKQTNKRKKEEEDNNKTNQTKRCSRNHVLPPRLYLSLSLSFSLDHPPTSAPIPSENRSMRFPVRVVATDRQAARYQQIGFGSSDWLNRREEAANSPGRGLTQLKLSLSLCRLSNKNDHQSKFPLNDLWVALHFFFFCVSGLLKTVRPHT